VRGGHACYLNKPPLGQRARQVTRQRRSRVLSQQANARTARAASLKRRNWCTRRGKDRETRRHMRRQRAHLSDSRSYTSMMSSSMGMKNSLLSCARDGRLYEVK
jgi:hypothetical protein